MNLIEVADPEDPAIGPFLGLRDQQLRQERERPGGDMAASFMAEGEIVIARAVAAGIEIERVLIDARRSDAIDALAGEEVDVLAGAPAVLQAVCGRPRLRDPIAWCVRPQLPDVEVVLAQARTVVVTEGVNNPTNMGVIVRCAAGLGIDAVLVDPQSCDPLYRRAVRVSMGEVFAIPHTRLGHLPEGLDALHQQGFRTVALTPTAARPIGGLAVDHDERVALILGAEGPGLSAPVRAACTDRVAIPMAAGVDSINVGSAAAVACYAIGQARRS